MKTQESLNHLSHKPVGELASSLARAIGALVGGRELADEFSAAAAHYDGLIDAIERAGWDVQQLEKVKHAFDETAQRLLNELLDNHPDMSEHEERSFIAPFQDALHQFARMTNRERLNFNAEYQRFSDLRARSIQELAAAEA